ncbi:MAG: DUF1700 domain-containing protein [Clostridiales bacterium]|nr:DUF1700 domain-containing protein [Clostridiales bacterium]
MKEQYIKQAEKELRIPRKAKKVVIRDLNEIFDSALENGETEQQVIDRLGTPKEFAESAAEQLGIDLAASRKSKRIVSSVIALAVAVIAFVLYGTARVRNVPADVIGQADSMTSIKVSDGFNLSAVLLAIGIIAVVAAVMLIVRSISKKRR